METSPQPAAPVATVASSSLLSQKRAQFSSMFATENKATVEAAAAATAAAMPSFSQKKHKEIIDMDPNGVSLLTNDEMEFGIDNNDVQAVAASEAPVAPKVAAAPKENPYLASIDSGIRSDKEEALKLPVEPAP